MKSKYKIEFHQEFVSKVIQMKALKNVDFTKNDSERRRMH